MTLPFPAAVKYANRKHYYHVLASDVATRQTRIVISLPPDPPEVAPWSAQVIDDEKK